jgi:hypothetical protein
MATVNSEKACELMYELLKVKPWLNSPGIMNEADHDAEDEALSFLLTIENAKSWGDCSNAARRVVNSLLLDFVARLLGPLSHRQWDVPDGLPKWRQAAKIISHEIHQNHPRFASRH